MCGVVRRVRWRGRRLALAVLRAARDELRDDGLVDERRRVAEARVDALGDLAQDAAGHLLRYIFESVTREVRQLTRSFSKTQ